MPGDIPTVTANEVRRALEEAGFVAMRQQGSHLTLRHPETRRSTTVPIHRGDVKPRLVELIIKQAGLTREDFLPLPRR